MCGIRAGVRNDCILSNCSNNGSIYGYGAGGLCGWEAGSYFGNCSLSNCKNSGSIYGNGAGGLCGFLAGFNGNCLFISCENSGDIFGNLSAGLCGSNAYTENISYGFISWIIIIIECKNLGLLKQNNAGQLGSIGKISIQIYISENTKVLEFPYENKEQIENLSSDKINKDKNIFNIFNKNVDYLSIYRNIMMKIF